jgi:hypothetical protein
MNCLRTPLKNVKKYCRSDSLMPQIIEWATAGPDEIVWRYPDEELTWEHN